MNMLKKIYMRSKGQVSYQDKKRKETVSNSNEFVFSFQLITKIVFYQQFGFYIRI